MIRTLRRVVVVGFCWLTAAYGLLSAIFTKDLGQGLRFADEVRTGLVNINETTNYWELNVPYGGMRHSGVGRIGGRASIEAMTDVQTIILDLRR